MAVCTITGTITLLDGSPAASQQVIVTIASAEADQSGQIASGVGVTSDAIEAFTDVNGVFSVDLVQGATVQLQVPGINLTKTIVVPALSTADFVSLV